MTPSNQSQEVVGTPLTDAKACRHTCDAGFHSVEPCSPDKGSWVNIDFARSLERSLIAKTKECEELGKENSALRVMVVKHECPYGHRNKDGVCNLGYPGCACADDVFCFENEHGRTLIQERDQLKAHVERLKIALALWDATFSKYKSWIANSAPLSQYPNAVAEDYENASKVTWPILESTPSQSLAEYRNKVIEECGDIAVSEEIDRIDERPLDANAERFNAGVYRAQAAVLSLRTTETKKGS
jgi:hypothetical protein